MIIVGAKVSNMKKKELPLIKENRIEKLTQVLGIFDKYPYNREKQSENVLKLYPNKIEKSVFRGMAIPSLRYLGLIIGYENLIRLSANGRILIEAKKRSNQQLLRAWSAIILELDQNRFGFTNTIRKGASQEIIRNKLVRLVAGPSEKQINERVKRWLKILIDSKLLDEVKGNVKPNLRNLEKARRDIQPIGKKKEFKNLLITAYQTFPYRETAGIVDIADLREGVAKLFYNKYNMILTEAQFDSLLRSTSFITKSYIISLGHTMGAEEKLFKLKGEYYRTITITLL